MIKKSISIIAALLVITCLLALLPAGAFAAEADSADTGCDIELVEDGAEGYAEVGTIKLTEKAFVKRLEELRQKYPHGSTFCGTYYENGTAKAWTCHAYACQMMYEVFGIQFYNSGMFNNRIYDFGTIHAGDLVRIDWNSHSIFITKVKGDKVWYTDANSDNYNGIAWDKELTMDQLRSRFSYKFHVEGNTLMGTGGDFELDTPELVSVESGRNSLTFNWSAADGAAGYRVYLKNEDTGRWNTLGDTGELFYELADPVYNTYYTFTVRALNAEGKLASDYDHDGVTGRYGYAPELYAEVQADKIILTWDKEDKASAYRAFYKGGDVKSWTAICDTEDTAAEFTGGEAGVTYYFTLRWLDTDGKYISDYQKPGVTAVFLTYGTQLATPRLIKAAPANSKGCIRLTWEKVDGAVWYQVFAIRKDIDTKWQKIGRTDASSFTHTDCVNDKVYRYTVRCIDDNGKYMSGYDKTGLTLHFYDLPEGIKAAATTVQGGVKLSWSARGGVYGYQTFYKREGVDANWKKLQKTTSTSVTQTGCANNTSYIYTVRCIDKNGNYISGYNADGVELRYYRFPEGLKAKQWGTDIIITHGKVKGAAGYATYYKSSENNSWTRLQQGVDVYDFQKLTNCKAGVKYTFTVRACDKNGKLISSYDPKGVSVSFNYKKQETWVSLYKDYVLNKKYLKAKTSDGFGSAVSDPNMYLYDMNADGTPELILKSGKNKTAADPTYVFTVRNDKVTYLGSFTANSISPYANPYESSKGFFVESGSSAEGKTYYVKYIHLSSGAVKSKTVIRYKNTGGKTVAEVNDENLYKAYAGCTCKMGGWIPSGIYSFSRAYSYKTVTSSKWTGFVRAFEY